MVDGCHDQTMRVAPRWLLLLEVLREVVSVGHDVHGLINELLFIVILTRAIKHSVDLFKLEIIGSCLLFKHAYKHGVGRQRGSLKTWT